MKFSSLITAVAVCALILGLILKRDDLLTYFNGDEDAVLAKINEDIAKAEATKAEAEAALAAAKAEVESAKANLPKDAVAENARDKAVSVLASKSLEQDVRSGILLRGQTSAFKFVEVKAETSGQVTSTPLRKGTLVSEGQLLCELDPGTKASDLAEARARLAEAQKNNAASAELVKKGFASETQAIGRRATLEAAEAAVIRAENNIKHLKIIAPFSGLLESDSAELGDLLQPGAPCARVIALNPIKLVGYATEQQVARIAENALAGAVLISGETLQGTVSFVSRSADQVTRTFRVEVLVPNDDLKIRDGSTADIYIDLEGTKGHLLPQSALTLDGDGRLGIRAAVNGYAKFMPVTIIRDTIEGVWVTGLPQSVDVIVLGQEYVVTGSPVDITYKEE